LVSVIIPAYNSAEFLPGAIASVRSQGYKPLEIVVVDDGSTDETGGLIRSLQGDDGGDLRYLRQDNRGPGAARNAGLATARGEVIAFLDADDIWPAGKLDCQMPSLTRHPETDIVLGRTQAMVLVGGDSADDPGWRFEPFAEPWYSTQLGSAIYRRRVFDRVGMFDATLKLSEDLDWFMRARERGVGIAFIDDVTLLYRFHHANLTRGTDASARNLLLVLKRSLDRRRDGGDYPLAPISPWHRDELDKGRDSDTASAGAVDS
jgi:glycosyltransferase involved in cell wall biosynthesis